MGKDRLAAAVGAYTIYPYFNVLVIDAGSAITFDMVSESGEYLGGNISPGLEMRFRALHEFTSKLPWVSKNENFPDAGFDTESSIVCGVQWGIINEIEGYILNYLAKFQNIKIILTGGDANFFDKKVKSPIFVVPNLVLIGLNQILKYNDKKL
ncbi:MAG: type III pantothenate kinase [Bacteroidales bacterium]|nr:type III pantothenate kinase [Bacteroidales bacterium]